MAFEICDCCIKEAGPLKRGEADVAAIAEKPPNNASVVTVINDKGAFGYATLANRTSEKLLLEKPRDHFQADAVAPLVVGISPLCGVALGVFCDPFSVCPRCALSIFCLPLTRAARITRFAVGINIASFADRKAVDWLDLLAICALLGAVLVVNFEVSFSHSSDYIIILS
jgi:hypothetical protein